MSDLWYEWPLNLCVALGIAALLFPLAVLYGLKFGAVSVLESRLAKDPRSRELRPAASGFFTHEWLAEQRRLEGVAFAVGLPKAVASSIRVQSVNREVEATVFPTAAGDPLLDSASLLPPEGLQCVISYSLASEAKLQTGDWLSFTVARREGAGWQQESARLRIMGILPALALDHPAILVPPKISDAIEDFLDGLPVPAFGWQGTAAIARPAYDGALVISGGQTDTESERSLLGERIGGTGFTTYELTDLSGLSGKTVWFLTNANRLVDESNLNLLRSKLDGAGFTVSPWLMGRVATLRLPNGQLQNVELRAWSEVLARAGIAPSSGGNLSAQVPWSALVSQELLAGSSENASLLWRGIASELALPVQLKKSAGVQPTELWLSAPAAGTLRRALERGVELQDGQLVYTRRGYASFRIGARSVADVLPLRDALERRGIRVLAETQRIADIQFLEKQLTTLFSLFAGVAGLGTITCLLAIAFSAAERKKRVIAFMQILGVSRIRIARFPLYQSVILSLAGAGLAWAAHGIFSTAVNRVFAAFLLPGERLSFLPTEAVVFAVSCLLLISIVCYVLVLPRFLGMPLGEAAREL